MKAAKNIMLREIAGEHLLIPVGEMAMNIHGMINLSESGMLLWNRLQKDCSEEDLIQCILDEYDVDRETARTDIQAFLDKMNQIGILVRGDSEADE